MDSTGYGLEDRCKVQTCLESAEKENALKRVQLTNSIEDEDDNSATSYQFCLIPG